jgi:2-oxoglutarate ferredoxin oxidoreductase subunit alpha
MVHLRPPKLAGIAASIGDHEADDPTGDADVLVLGWGSTYGPITAAVRAVRARGGVVARTHLRYLNPFPPNTGEVLRRYRTVLVPEMNLGQLRQLLRARFLVDVQGYNQVRGLPFTTSELVDALTTAIAASQQAAASTDEPVAGQLPDGADRRPADDSPAGHAAPEQEAS